MLLKRNRHAKIQWYSDVRIRLARKYLQVVNFALLEKGPPVARKHPKAYPPEFRQKIVELARAGRQPDDLAHEFSLARQTVRYWIKQHELDSGGRSDGLTSEERAELFKLRAPALVLADEPTGELDSRTAESILALFDVLNARGQTLVVVTHSAAVYERARRVIRIADGKIVADGT
jgi:transposase-like protein